MEQAKIRTMETETEKRGPMDSGGFDTGMQSVEQAVREQMFVYKRNGNKTGRLVIDGNSVYEVDEECMRQREKG